MRLNYWWNGASASSKLKKINFIFFIGCGSQRNQQSNSLHSLSLVGYGLAGQPRAPPKEENGMKESCEVEWSRRQPTTAQWNQPAVNSIIDGMNVKNEINDWMGRLVDEQAAHQTAPRCGKPSKPPNNHFIFWIDCGLFGRSQLSSSLSSWNEKESNQSNKAKLRIVWFDLLFFFDWRKLWVIGRRPLSAGPFRFIDFMKSIPLQLLWFVLLMKEKKIECCWMK